MIRIPVPGPSLARWRLIAHWRAMEARRYVERLLGRQLTAAEFYAFAAPIRAQHRGAAFTLIEAMICLAIVVVIAAIAVPNLIKAREGTKGSVGVQSFPLPGVGRTGHIVVLPTGERVLILTGNGTACTLLPPAPDAAKAVE